MEEVLVGGRIDKVTQPEKDTLVLLIRAGSANQRLLLCASPNNARWPPDRAELSQPAGAAHVLYAPAKQLLGGRIMSLKQIGGDRVVHLTVDTVDELGDHVNRVLILEVMGRHSNLILTDGNGRIIDAARHVSQDMSRVRLIQPGLTYAPPPGQNKLDPAEATAEKLLPYLEKNAALPLQKALGQSLSGYSAQAARELCCRVTGGNQITVEAGELPRLAERIADFLQRMPSLTPPVVLVDEHGDPADVFPFPYVSCDTERQQPAASLSAALERYFGVRDQKDRIDQKSASMVRLLKTHIERCEKKLALQNEELENAGRMEEYRLMGELLNANLWQLHRGQEAATVQNFYDENGATSPSPWISSSPRLRTPSGISRNTKRRVPPVTRRRSRRKKRWRSCPCWKAPCWTWASAWAKAS